MWQDIILTIVSVLFSYALIPQAVKGFKNKNQAITLQTSLINTIGMYTVCFIYFTLNLYFSTVVSLITATLWLTLFIQRIIYKK